MLGDSERATLLGIARESITSALDGSPLPKPTSADGGLGMCCGAFVTLRGPDGELRGCVGTFERDRPLWRVVAEFARVAAFRDGRFRAVAAAELPGIKFEISALSPLEERTDPLDFELGRHGVWVVGKGGECGTFLPQVAVETGWSKEDFLSYCCSHKAGISADAWRDSERCKVYVYTADVFSE